MDETDWCRTNSWNIVLFQKTLELNELIIANSETMLSCKFTLKLVRIFENDFTC